mmetsp:Transcript_7243/g.24064  ORF Transcript_7243/g.24064 Transcript_7243/m.24064 type:complete len:85 (+) Transcript_7243:121-375(+)
MSWIYQAGGGTAFWEEQIKSERRIKQRWDTTNLEEVSEGSRPATGAVAQKESAEQTMSSTLAKDTRRPRAKPASLGMLAPGSSM